uniref:Uncharacterized protein n=1 Tax=Timema bartmani TaxID=61472 RepID=A0A7R9FBS7_9NEOP|nr:unnamed protein product [Timema bartmani]
MSLVTAAKITLYKHQMNIPSTEAADGPSATSDIEAHMSTGITNINEDIKDDCIINNADIIQKIHEPKDLRRGRFVFSDINCSLDIIYFSYFMLIFCQWIYTFYLY